LRTPKERLEWSGVLSNQTSCVKMKLKCREISFSGAILQFLHFLYV
jgi:hypothetical protein